MAEKASPLPAPNEKLVRVFDTEQEMEALVVRGLLESAGIDSELGESENSPDVLPLGAVGVLVREENAAQARQIIAEYRRPPQEEQAEEEEFDEAAMNASCADDPSEEQQDK
jgi:Putative prokaryotic signal transducing protein